MAIEIDSSMAGDVWPNGQPMDLTVLDPKATKGVPMVRFRTPEGHILTTTLIDYNKNLPELWESAKNVRG